MSGRGANAAPAGDWRATGKNKGQVEGQVGSQQELLNLPKTSDREGCLGATDA